MRKSKVFEVNKHVEGKEVEKALVPETGKGDRDRVEQLSIFDFVGVGESMRIKILPL
ncbi:hypothetical protein NC661_04405 [Aquibacillus koreensis]|uniref:Uncharacterized protein n=1 Tax=Aquibacillus koreensis TaxID=279446 RepID=A0A9X4AIP8_9BACI|nr:hypothetical protein [Aquibacillus koreensis]MCT2534784.1 hypothetical protein [Aquibacillus koreensis]MDC3419605.1 hypothetical protein [Aquibacillus koreensis]